ncbi:MAG: hypothetical protein ACLFNK_04560 [Candidatus Woesearchaeota archaeon]
MIKYQQAPFSLSDENNISHTTYFVVPYSRGMEVDASGEKIILINPKAPVARNAFGRKVGDCRRL